MAQEAPNSVNNINIPHNVSLWFDRDFSGTFVELGDVADVAVTLAPEFADFRSYRNGINALRKRLLTAEAASISAVLNEPNIRNLERVGFGSAPVSGQSTTVLEGKHLDIKERVTGAGDLVFNMADAGETDFGNITITGIYAATDVLEATNLIAANLAVDTDGMVDLGETDFTLSDTHYVRYEVAVSSLFSTTIFGAASATVEGAAKLQSRNLSGGVKQIWDIASVHLAPNGDLPYPLDAVQTIPILLTLQERASLWGTIYAS